MKEVYLYFRTQASASAGDDDGSDDSCMFPLSKFTGMHPTAADTLTLFFEPVTMKEKVQFDHDGDSTTSVKNDKVVVTLATNDTHKTVMQDLAMNQMMTPDGTMVPAIGSGQAVGASRFNQMTGVDSAGNPVYGNVQSYMNPYQQAVIDMAKEAARDQSLKASNLIAQDAAASGGLGGYREAIMQSERENALAKQIGDIQLAGSAENYAQAQAAFDRDRAARFSGIGIDQATRAQQLGAAGALADLGFARQRAEIDRLDQLGQAGTARQAMQQQIYDMGYQEFQDQLAYPRQNISFFQQALRGMPITPGQQVSSYQPTPSAASTMLGLGLGGLGIYQALGGMR